MISEIVLPNIWLYLKTKVDQLSGLMKIKSFLNEVKKETSVLSMF